MHARGRPHAVCVFSRVYTPPPPPACARAPALHPPPPPGRRLQLFFDNERWNCTECSHLGIHCVYTPQGARMGRVCVQPCALPMVAGGGAWHAAAPDMHACAPACGRPASRLKSPRGWGRWAGGEGAGRGVGRLHTNATGWGSRRGLRSIGPHTSFTTAVYRCCVPCCTPVVLR